jgi:hypothetical protein
LNVTQKHAAIPVPVANATEVGKVGAEAASFNVKDRGCKANLAGVNVHREVCILCDGV